MIEPHGGRLVNRIVSGERTASLEAEARELPVIQLNPFEVSDLEMLAIGAFSPLEGFMGRADYDRVIKDKRLASGLPWTLPVTLAVDQEKADSLKSASRVALADANGALLAVLEIQDVFRYDREAEVLAVFLTANDDHPGARYVASRGDWIVGGPVHVFRRPNADHFSKYRLDPADTRRLFEEKGWKTVVGFQTRNPVHRAHEYIQKSALEIVDGLLLHPIAGETKSDDISLEVRLRCYEVLLENYYPRDRAQLALNPASMRYAGPREAIFHAIMRRNYGCTHFIVGRDHAGVGDYYGTYDAQKIFDTVDMAKLGIQPLKFEHAFFCTRCRQMVSRKTCPHGKENHIFLSGTKVRELLSRGERPPAEFSRPEVARILIDAQRGNGKPA